MNQSDNINKSDEELLLQDVKKRPMYIYICFVILTFIVTEFLFLFYHFIKKLNLFIQSKVLLPPFIQQNLKFIIIWLIVSVLFFIMFNSELKKTEDSTK